MATDCIIENWIMRNKPWLVFLVWIIGTWILSVFGIMLFKYWYFDLSWDDSRISLSNIINLGVAIGTIALVIFAWIAYKSYWKQKKDNEVFAKLIELIDLINSDIIIFKMGLSNFITTALMYINSAPPPKMNISNLEDMIYKSDVLLQQIKLFENEHVTSWEIKIKYLKVLNSSIGYESTQFDEISNAINKIKPLILSELFSPIKDIKQIFVEHLQNLRCSIERANRDLMHELSPEKIAKHPSNITIDEKHRNVYSALNLGFLIDLETQVELFLATQIKVFS